MKTIQVDILNDQALKLLQDLEGLKLIRLRREAQRKTNSIDWSLHKGKMTKQSLKDIDAQLEKLRSEW